MNPRDLCAASPESSLDRARRNWASHGGAWRDMRERVEGIGRLFGDAVAQRLDQTLENLIEYAAETQHHYEKAVDELRERRESDRRTWEIEGSEWRVERARLRQLLRTVAEHSGSIAPEWLPAVRAEVASFEEAPFR